MNPASAIPANAQHAAHEVAPWIEKLARVGFVAKAILYMTIGALATSAALGLGGTVGTAGNARNGTVDSRGAMSKLLEAPFGRTLLYVIAAGLFGYALWRVIEAIANPEGKHGAKGVALRLRSAGVAIIHFGLGYSAVRIAMGSQQAGDQGKQTQHWAGRALTSETGTMALYAIALGLAGYGAYQLYKAWRAKLNKHLALGSLSHTARMWVVGVSRFGIAARGVVFITTGGLLAKAVRDHNPSQVGSPTESLKKLVDFGTIPFVIIAVGLIAYGVYQLINAKYRRINVA
jgi:hypothetical protein